MWFLTLLSSKILETLSWIQKEQNRNKEMLSLSEWKISC